MTEHVVGKDRGEVKIGQHSWLVRPLTRSAAKASSEIPQPPKDEKYEPTFEEMDKQARAMINYIDKRLGGETPAGTVLESMWDDDSVGLDDLGDLAEFLSPEQKQNGSGPPP